MSLDSWWKSTLYVWCSFRWNIPSHISVSSSCLKHCITKLMSGTHMHIIDTRLVEASTQCVWAQRQKVQQDGTSNPVIEYTMEWYSLSIQGCHIYLFQSPILYIPVALRSSVEVIQYHWYWRHVQSSWNNKVCWFVLASVYMTILHYGYPDGLWVGDTPHAVSLALYWSLTQLLAV